MQRYVRRILDIRHFRHALIVLAVAALVACGGGGGGGPGGGGANTAPTADAGPDQTVFENTAVNLAGSGTDANGDSLTYSWTQTGGQTVTINNANVAAADTTAPDVVAGAPETLTFRLEVSDGAASRSDIVNVVVEENVAPVANAGVDRTVIENAAITLDGTASSDPNVQGTLSYAWTQTGGPAVTLTDADTAQPSFMSPDVGAGASVQLMFELAVSDSVFNDTDLVTITVEEGQPFVTVSGTVLYEFVPPAANCAGLNFNAISSRPIRGATVQLIDSGTGNVLQAMAADAVGGYSFANVDSNTLVRLRVRAELKQNGTPSWDVEIRDNFIAGASDSDVPPPPVLGTRALYVLDGADFDTTGFDITRDLTATTGWGGASYTGPRAAAPFAVLDAIYSGVQFVLTADPNAIFAPMDAFWSANNSLSTTSDITAGQLTASFYRGDLDSLFLLGDAAIDTEEFDDHVIMHEWGHYFEDNFSRSDSVGGPHALGQSLDMRLAFGEGWATALAAMALNNPIYCDTGPAGSSGGFGIDAEADGFGLQGWYNEISVTTFIYDLWDTNNDGTDNDSIGFGPIFATMAGSQSVTPAWTSIFTFATELRSTLNAAQQTFLDSQLTRENINPVGLDIWASMETNNASNFGNELPLFVDITADGGTTNICTDNKYDTPDRTGNKLAEYRYIRLTVPVTDTYDVVLATTTATPPTADPNDRDQSDPDMFIFLNGAFVAQGVSGDANVETFTTPTLTAGQTYVADLRDFRYADGEAGAGTPAGYPTEICIDVTFTATP